MKSFIIIFTVLISSQISSQTLPKGFSYVSEIDATIKKELRYATSNNFIGKPIDGYLKDSLIISTPAAKALKKIQTKLMLSGLSLKIFDAYRPQQAVDHFVRWAKVMNDTLMKQLYYPDVQKSELFTLGFIASKSGHTRGSTVDLSIVDVKTNKEVDMGSSYDFFGEKSHPFYKKITEAQMKNRMLLRTIMIKNGFIPYDNEWWHFTLKDEPYPTTYFNFLIE
ncbi:MAG: M15 family metallopeptidase [Flavobacterium sp.]|jgi:D-alanyl-D-alanine dipeptidase|nr:M15 family metallopeptidase [Flavobacterium sp.]MBT5288595.1 M15 family metallopeptidase [Flavobacterium sp.]MBT6377974.1 M15 family metallopeptidase [Flavobacterium sp.]MBT7425992.1 M15 family metallopeptidase [Flavobacterium sp.]